MRAPAHYISGSRWGDVMHDVDVERSTGSAEAVSVYTAGWSNARGTQKVTFGDGVGAITVAPPTNMNRDWLVAKASASGTALWAVSRVEVRFTRSFVS